MLIHHDKKRSKSTDGGRSIRGSKACLSCKLKNDGRLTRQRGVEGGGRFPLQVPWGQEAGAGGRKEQWTQHEAGDQVKNWIMQGQACSLLRNNFPKG